MSCLLLKLFLCIILKYVKNIHALRHFGKCCTVLFQAMPFQYAPGFLLWYFIKMSNLYKTFNFPYGTCWLLVSCQYLALDGVYHQLWTAFPSNWTLARPRTSMLGAATGLTPPTGWALIRRTWAPHEQPLGWLLCKLLTRACVRLFGPCLKPVYIKQSHYV